MTVSATRSSAITNIARACSAQRLYLGNQSTGRPIRCLRVDILYVHEKNYTEKVLLLPKQSQ